jgi:hypothetical protein
MEALSPRSTNHLIRPKVSMERKVLDKNAAASAAAQKAASSRIHAPPPPSLVVEPVEGGERYSTGAFLGKGGFAICYEGTLLRNGRVFAMKVVRSEMAQRKMQEKVCLSCIRGASFESFANQPSVVPHRTSNTFENAASPHRRISSCLCI